MKEQRLMALDVGDKRIGVAISDPMLLFAQPLTTIEVKSLKLTIVELVSLINKHNISKLILGWPKELSGEIGERAKRVEQFKNKLEGNLRIQGIKIPIVLWDERLSSVQAEKLIIGSKHKNALRHGIVDRVAASIILESYLTNTANSASDLLSVENQKVGGVDD
jgi:putative holliday junction resolvase